MMKMKFFVFAAAVIAALSMTAVPASADLAGKVKKAQKQCNTCHSFKAGKKKAGPSLHKVVGRKCGAHEGYKYGKGYKKACKKAAFVIDEAFLMDYLKNPSKHLKKLSGSKSGSKMSYKIKKEDVRKEVITWLKTK